MGLRNEIAYKSRSHTWRLALFCAILVASYVRGQNSSMSGVGSDSPGAAPGLWDGITGGDVMTPTPLSAFPQCGDGGVSDTPLDCSIDSNLGSNQTLVFSFTASTEAVLDGTQSVMITLRSLGGEAGLSVLTPDSQTPNIFGVPVYRGPTASEEYISLSSSRLANNAGDYIVVIQTPANRAFVSLRIQSQFIGNTLVESEVEALRQLQSECCGLRNVSRALVGLDWCSSVFPIATDENRTLAGDLCNMAPNTCDVDGHLTKLMLGGAGMSCSGFPQALASFTHLETVDLAFNEFLDTFDNAATVLSVLPNLTHVFLRYTNLSGEIPCSLSLPKLQYLTISGNDVTGSIPECLLQSTTLTEFYCSDTNVTGQIPEISEDSKLITLFMKGVNNEGMIEGTIPRTIANARNLQFLELSGNNLTGPIPPLPPILNTLNLSTNFLSGSLPALPKTLTMLDITDNELEGSLPADLSDSTNLTLIVARDNYLSGSIPTLPPNLIALILDNNELDGEIPDFPNSLEYVDVSFNSLGGELPDSLPSSLQRCYMSDNQLEGSIPVSYTNARSLLVLDLSNNKLDQDISNMEWNNTWMTWLRLDGNQLSGSVPSSMALGLPNLVALSLGDNKLTGTLDDFGTGLRSAANSSLNQVNYFNISNNQIQGSIPHTLNQLGVFSRNLYIVDGAGNGAPRIADLSNNKFQGNFPRFLIEELGSVLQSCRCILSVDVTGNVLQCPRSLGYSLTPEDINLLETANFTCHTPDNRQITVADAFTTSTTSNGTSSPSGTTTTEQETLQSDNSVQRSSNNKSSKLNAGAIAGIVIGTVLGAALLGALALVATKFWRRRRAETGHQKFYGSDVPQGTPHRPNVTPHPAGDISLSNV